MRAKVRASWLSYTFRERDHIRRDTAQQQSDAFRMNKSCVRQQDIRYA